MGITGLLPALKSVTHQVHIAKYAGKTVGIDAAGWLYRGAYSCAVDVVLRTKNADGYLNYCLEQIKVLQEHDVTPIFVFDGANLPAKAELNAMRNRNRQVWKTKAMRQRDNGDESGSYAAFTKAVSVTNAMIKKFIAVLRRMDIAFIVAPYEADAQLAYMSRQKIVDVVVSEDSDCVPYGCKVMLFKWSPEGWASELKRRSLGANEELSFVGWTEEMFIQLCVLCGCDYCPSVPGVGIVTAYKFVETHKSPIEVVKALQKQKHSVLPPNYAERYYAAIITFRHHLVFDPRDRTMKMLNPLTLSSDILPLVDKELHFLGNIELRDDVVALIACGDVHPVTLDSYDWTDAVDALREEQQQLMQKCLAPKPSAHSMTSTESSAMERPERASRHESDEQSSRSTSLSQLDACDPDAQTSAPSSALAQRNSTVPLPHEHEDREQPKPASTSWSHLDSVLGTSLHILNFRSPKVSDNFRPLVALPHRSSQALGSDTTASELRAFEHQSVRQSVKRIKNPTKRRREDSGSGFDGEVMCRIDSTTATYRPPPAPRVAEAPHTVLAIARSHEPSKPPLKRPLPFASHCAADPATRDTSTSENAVAHIRHDAPWTLDPPRASAHSSDLSVYSRATYAEEKWDRILGAELEAQSSSSTTSACGSPMQIARSQSNASDAPSH